VLVVGCDQADGWDARLDEDINMETFRIDFDEMVKRFRRVLDKAGFDRDRAGTLARIFAENTLDGVHSHGVNRFADFVRSVDRGTVRPEAECEKVASFGAWEQWDGNAGPGPLNALACTDRVCELARTHGVGCAALRNTNHWMRPGAYGWRAATRGFVFMCWTNTMPNMPCWGARQRRVGNNPLVLAVPRADGPVVLDMAMSQFAGGKLDIFERHGEPLPVPGGYDESGRLTTDAQAVMRSGRALPMGYWKGSSLAILLDLTAAILSGGLATHEIARLGDEAHVSQVFVAMDAVGVLGADRVNSLCDEAIAYVHSAEPVSPEDRILYPGQRVLEARRDGLANGIPVDTDIWREVLAL